MEPNQSERRRNMLDIIADLGLRERKDQLTSEQAPALALVPSPEGSRTQPSAPDEVVQALTDAQRRATEQRIAAERLLHEALALEQRLAEEAEQARKASEHALVQQLAAAVEAALQAEQKAEEQVELSVKKLERVAAEKREAEALKADDARAVAEARRALEIATASCSESDRRFADASAAEDAARNEAEGAAQLVTARRNARKELETDLHDTHQRIQGSAGELPTLTSIDELRALEARRRVAERRVADSTRQIAG
jgi:fused signal recognition particle receptor